MPVTKSSFPGSRLRPVNLDPDHYRSGRWFLLAEGLVLVGLGLTALIERWSGVVGTPDGEPVLWLRLAPLHAWVLLAFGMAALVATPWHRVATTAVTAVGVVGFLLLFAIGTPAAAGAGMGVHGSVAGAWRMDLRDSALHAVLLAYNLVLAFWLATTAIQGRVWVRRRDAKRDRPAQPGSGAGEGNGSQPGRPGDQA